MRARREAEQLIERHWIDVTTLAGALLEARTLTGVQVQRILRQESVTGQVGRPSRGNQA